MNIHDLAVLLVEKRRQNGELKSLKKTIEDIAMTSLAKSHRKRRFDDSSPQDRSDRLEKSERTNRSKSSRKKSSRTKSSRTKSPRNTKAFDVPSKRKKSRSSTDSGFEANSPGCSTGSSGSFAGSSGCSRISGVSDLIAVKQDEPDEPETRDDENFVVTREQLDELDYGDDSASYRCDLCLALCPGDQLQSHLQTFHDKLLFMDSVHGDFKRDLRSILKHLIKKKGLRVEDEGDARVKCYRLIKYPHPMYRTGYYCLICRTHAIRKSEWLVHLSACRANGNMKLLYCRYCDRTFTSKQELKRHFKQFPIDGDKPCFPPMAAIVEDLKSLEAGSESAFDHPKTDAGVSFNRVAVQDKTLETISTGDMDPVSSASDREMSFELTSSNTSAHCHTTNQDMSFENISSEDTFSVHRNDTSSVMDTSFIRLKNLGSSPKREPELFDAYGVASGIPAGNNVQWSSLVKQIKPDPDALSSILPLLVQSNPNPSPLPEARFTHDTKPESLNHDANYLPEAQSYHDPNPSPEVRFDGNPNHSTEDRSTQDPNSFPEGRSTHDPNPAIPFSDAFQKIYEVPPINRKFRLQYRADCLQRLPAHYIWDPSERPAQEDKHLWLNGKFAGVVPVEPAQVGEDWIGDMILYKIHAT